MFNKCVILFFINCVTSYRLNELNKNDFIRDNFVKNIRLKSERNEDWYQTINSNLLDFNKLISSISWQQMVGNDPKGNNENVGTVLGLMKLHWQKNACELGSKILKHQSSLHQRVYYLLCRGPRYTSTEARKASNLLDNMSSYYTTSKVCVPKNTEWIIKSLDYKIKSNKSHICLRGEPDLDKLMAKPNLTLEQSLWIWKSWYNTVGPKIKKPFVELVKIQNNAAKRNNYNDMGEVWREELEIPNLEEFVEDLYGEIEPFYLKLHAVVRYALVQKYGIEVIDPVGPIPAHLLGNLWAQDWSSLMDLLLPDYLQKINLDKQIKQKKWKILDMVKVAEDMYVSLGLPKMTEKFWKYSKFVQNGNSSTLCHGTAANLFEPNDYRILLCAQLSMEDFYVIHHEMGHIEYFMAYKNQPPIFQEGANSAFQESIGDAIMTGVMSPSHLKRLGLLTDQQLLDPNLDIILLLQQALAKIPQIPHALVIDKFRWGVFRGNIKSVWYNTKFWELNRKFRGIVPPEERLEKYFDAAAKFHIPDNTPYIRYFLSSILQVQMFKGMCNLTLYGNVQPPTNQSKNKTEFPLHRCDIYGSRKAGTKLKEMMQLGASVHWKKSLKILTGENNISTKPLLNYYKLLIDWLDLYITTNNVPIGW